MKNRILMPEDKHTKDISLMMYLILDIPHLNWMMIYLILDISYLNGKKKINPSVPA